jgi:hypothetical protein
MRKDELTDMIEKSLGAAPVFRLQEGFAQRVTASVVRKEQWKTDLQEYFYLMAIVFGLIALLTGVYYLVDKDLLLRTLNFFVTNWVAVGFLVFTLNFILFADKVLLRLMFSRRRQTN